MKDSLTSFFAPVL